MQHEVQKSGVRMSYEGIKQEAKGIYNLILGNRKEESPRNEIFPELQQFVGKIANYRGFNWSTEEIQIRKVHGWSVGAEVFGRSQAPDIVFETGRCDKEKNTLLIQNVEGTHLNYAVNIESSRQIILPGKELDPLIKYGSICMNKLNEMEIDFPSRKELIPHEITNNAAKALMNIWNIDNSNILDLVIAPATEEQIDIRSHAAERKRVLEIGEDGLRKEIKEYKSEKEGYGGNLEYIDNICQLDKLIEKNERLIKKLRDGILQKETCINIGVLYETDSGIHRVNFDAEPIGKLPDTSEYKITMISLDECLIKERKESL